MSQSNYGFPKARIHKMNYSDDTIRMAEHRAFELQQQFVDEVKRLLRSGAVDADGHNRGLLFGVAMENLADGFLRGEKQTREYRNLRKF